jgi:hypothetical protein
MTEPDPNLIDKRTPGYAAHAAKNDPAGDIDLLAPRPEPVIDAAKLAGLLSAAVIAVLGVVGLVVGGNVLGNLDALANALTAAGIAIGAVVAYLLPVWQARKARAKVTPLADPRDPMGRKLVPRR